MLAIDQEVEAFCNRAARVVHEAMDIANDDKVDEELAALENDAANLIEQVRTKNLDPSKKVRLEGVVRDAIDDVSLFFRDIFMKNELERTLKSACPRGSAFKGCISYKATSFGQLCPVCRLKKAPGKI